jgi:hypothetical protein
MEVDELVVRGYRSRMTDCAARINIGSAEHRQPGTRRGNGCRETLGIQGGEA